MLCRIQCIAQVSQAMAGDHHHQTNKKDVSYIFLVINYSPSSLQFQFWEINRMVLHYIFPLFFLNSFYFFKLCYFPTTVYFLLSWQYTVTTITTVYNSIVSIVVNIYNSALLPHFFSFNWSHSDYVPFIYWFQISCMLVVIGTLSFFLYLHLLQVLNVIFFGISSA